MVIGVSLLKTFRLGLVAVSVLLFVGMSSGCYASKPAIKLPQGFIQKPVTVKKASVKNSSFICSPTPKPYVDNLVFTSKYEGSDSSRSTLNPKAYQQYLNQTKTIVALQKAVSSLSSKYQYKGDIQVRACALGMLSDWAKAHALLSKETNHTGRAARKWTLAAASSSYAKLTSFDANVADVDLKQKQLIENWLSTLADIVVVDYTQSNMAKINNHDYWAAWGVGITGAVLQRKELLDWSYGKFVQAMSQVNDKGFLPNELKRKHLALNYHNFALGPLVSLALVLNDNQYDVLSINHGALPRLVDRTLQGLAKPEIFQEQSGSKQTMDKLLSNTGLAWLEPWLVLTPSAHIPFEWKSLRPFSSSRLGGDLTLLYTRQKVIK